MKKSIFGKKLKRDKNERTALFKSLISALVLNESIKTTEAKAKAIKPEIDKLVTHAKKGTNASMQKIHGSLSHIALDRFISHVAPRFKDRNGGYTRIIKIGGRVGDEAKMVILEWVEKSDAPYVKQVKAKKVKKTVKKETKVKKVKEVKVSKKTIKKAVKKTK
ncbi:MAG: ribosomal protein L17, large subunit ribosomal protein L17 [Microgenomates group bacterium GW2011_GWC1_49_7]|nr:MAG: ribosomal protein L17, large subunit ribosomal protein L17 [Microgenomates group bacterium GW2011_GWC1_49_7]